MTDAIMLAHTSNWIRKDGSSKDASSRLIECIFAQPTLLYKYGQALTGPIIGKTELFEIACDDGDADRHVQSKAAYKH